MENKSFENVGGSCSFNHTSRNDKERKKKFWRNFNKRDFHDKSSHHFLHPRFENRIMS
jgi:hypothetical protein